MRSFSLYVSIYIFFLSCKSEKDNFQIIDSDKNTKEIISKPFPNILHPKEIISFNAAKGSTLTFNSGSKMWVPANAFVDANGYPVKGNVDIHFIEYKDAMDRFLSGVPMTYDTIGKTYVFESAAMCTVFGFHNNNPIFINKQNPPTLSLITEKTDQDFNVYYFDSIKNVWIPKGKSKVIIQQNPAGKKSIKLSNNKVNENVNILLKPKKLNPNKITLTVNIPYVDEIPELRIFKNAKFEVFDPENKYNPKDGDIEWDKVELEKTEKLGWYKLIFTLGKRKLIYDVQPVLEENDYENAMKLHLEYVENINTKERMTALIRDQMKIQAEKYQSFPLKTFGTINVDVIYKNNPLELKAVWSDSLENLLSDKVDYYILYHSLNSYITLRDTIYFLPEQKHTILGICGDSTYYCTFKDSKSIIFDDKTKTLKLKMNLSKNKIVDKNMLLSLPEL